MYRYLGLTIVLPTLAPRCPAPRSTLSIDKRAVLLRCCSSRRVHNAPRAGMVSSTHEHHEYVRKHKFPAPVQREDVERDWLPRGYSCDLWTDPPGKEWRDFSHREDELVVVVSGRMEFVIGGDRCVLEPGDEALIPAGVKHSTKNLGDTEAQWLYGYA